MGWKAIKEHYRIEHTVQVRDDLICIGSAYVHDIITVRPDGAVVSSFSRNGEIARYMEEMEADRSKLIELYHVADQFKLALPVFTYDRDGNIIEKLCEGYGWPNVTHDGEMMFENTFSPDRTFIVAAAIRDKEAGVANWSERIDEHAERIAEAVQHRARCRAALKKLQATANG